MFKKLHLNPIKVSINKVWYDWKDVKLFVKNDDWIAIVNNKIVGKNGKQ